MCNIRVPIEKYLQHKCDLNYNGVEFSNRIRHEGPCHAMGNFNFDSNIMDIIEASCKDANRAVFINNNIGKFIRTTAEVPKGYDLSSLLYNIYLEKTMFVAHNEYSTSVSIGGRPLCDLVFC